MFTYLASISRHRLRLGLIRQVKAMTRGKALIQAGGDYFIVVLLYKAKTQLK